MQGAFLTITIGIEFFILVGYLFYFIFRSYGKDEDRISMMKWMFGLIGVLTAGLIVHVILVAALMTVTDIVVATAILSVDVIGLYLLIDDTNKLSKASLVKEA